MPYELPVGAPRPPGADAHLLSASYWIGRMREGTVVERAEAMQQVVSGAHELPDAQREALNGAVYEEVAMDAHDALDAKMQLDPGVVEDMRALARVDGLFENTFEVAVFFRVRGLTHMHWAREELEAAEAGQRSFVRALASNMCPEAARLAGADLEQVVNAGPALSAITGYLAGEGIATWISAIKLFTGTLEVPRMPGQTEAEYTAKVRAARVELLDTALFHVFQALFARMRVLEALSEDLPQDAGRSDSRPLDEELANLSLYRRYEPKTALGQLDFRRLDPETLRFYLFQREWDRLTRQWFMLHQLRRIEMEKYLPLAERTKFRARDMDLALPKALIQRAAPLIQARQVADYSAERLVRVFFTVNRYPSKKVLETFYENFVPGWSWLFSADKERRVEFLRTHLITTKSVTYVPKGAGYLPDHVTQAYPRSVNEPGEPIFVRFRPVRADAFRVEAFTVINDAGVRTPASLDAFDAQDGGESDGEGMEVDAAEEIDQAKDYLFFRLCGKLIVMLETLDKVDGPIVERLLKRKSEIVVSILAYAVIQRRSDVKALLARVSRQASDREAVARAVERIVEAKTFTSPYEQVLAPYVSEEVIETVANVAAVDLTVKELDFVERDGNKFKVSRVDERMVGAGDPIGGAVGEFGRFPLVPQRGVDREEQVVYVYTGANSFLWATPNIVFQEMLQTADKRKLYTHQTHSSQRIFDWLRRVGIGVPESEENGVKEGEGYVVARAVQSDL